MLVRGTILDSYSSNVLTLFSGYALERPLPLCYDLGDHRLWYVILRILRVMTGIYFSHPNGQLDKITIILQLCPRV